MKGMLWCAALAAAGVACTPIEKKPPAAQAPADTAPPPAPPVPTATKVTALEGFQVPVAVLYDTAQDVYFVSNVNGLRMHVL